MRMHTDTLNYPKILEALGRAKSKDRVAEHVGIEVFSVHRSRSHMFAYEIQLGTYEKVKGDKRGYKNTGQYGADSEQNGGRGLWAATYDEWGWFIAELFAVDPGMKFGVQWTSPDAFERGTEGKYDLSNDD